MEKVAMAEATLTFTHSGLRERRSKSNACPEEVPAAKARPSNASNARAVVLSRGAAANREGVKDPCMRISTPFRPPRPPAT